MKKLLKPLIMSLGGALFCGIFGFNVNAMNIQVPVFHRDPNIGTTKACNNCDFIKVKIEEQMEHNYIIFVDFHSSQNLQSDLNSVYQPYEACSLQESYYLKLQCDKDIFIPIENVTPAVLEALKTSASAYHTGRVVSDLLEGRQVGINFVQHLVNFSNANPEFSKRFKEYLNTKLENAGEWETKMFEKHIISYLQENIK